MRVRTAVLTLAAVAAAGLSGGAPAGAAPAGGVLTARVPLPATGQQRFADIRVSGTVSANARAAALSFVALDAPELGPDMRAAAAIVDGEIIGRTVTFRVIVALDALGPRRGTIGTVEMSFFASAGKWSPRKVTRTLSSCPPARYRLTDWPAFRLDANRGASAARVFASIGQRAGRRAACR